jgi:hypothetical protein
LDQSTSRNEVRVEKMNRIDNVAMLDETLVPQISTLLGDELLDASGGVFSSGPATLKRGDFYIVGHNPGGDEQETVYKDLTIRKDLEKWKKNGHYWSSFFPTDDHWREDGGDTAHQWRVRDLGELLNGNDQGIRKIFCSNAIFVRTRSSDLLKQVAFQDYRERCWRVHKLCLAIVRPKLIVCLGNDERDNASSFSLMKEWMGAQGSTVHREDCRHPHHLRPKYVKWFETTVTVGSQEDQSPLPCRVVGVPHPSRFEIVKLDRIRSLLEKMKEDCC